MRNQIALSLALLALVACDASDASQPCTDETSSTSTDTGTETGDPLEPYCCNCPSGECWGEPDKVACGAITAATGEQHSWCEGTVQECLSECKLTTICCACEPTPPQCMYWAWGDEQCHASAGASALFCEDASLDTCAAQCGP